MQTPDPSSAPSPYRYAALLHCVIGFLYPNLSTWRAAASRLSYAPVAHPPWRRPLHFAPSTALAPCRDMILAAWSTPAGNSPLPPYLHWLFTSADPLPQYIPGSDTVEELCDAVYPATALSAVAGVLYTFAERSIITICNDAATVFKDRLIGHMPGRSRMYWSADRARGASARDQPTLTDHPPEYLHSINIPSLPPSELALKVGAPIMLIWNLR